MHSWRKFFAGLASLGRIIIPFAFVLFLLEKKEGFLSSSQVLKYIMPDWEPMVLSVSKTVGQFISSYFPWAAIVFFFFLIIGPSGFTQRMKILWRAFWVFFVFSIIIFLFQIGDPQKLPVWPNLINLAQIVINKSLTIFQFNSYVGWAFGLALIYSLLVYFKDLFSALLNFFFGFLDRRMKFILIDELKTALGLRLIRTPASLNPVSPSLFLLLMFVFLLGGAFLYFVRYLKDESVILVINILGATILVYGFIQIFGLILIFLTGLTYYLLKEISSKKGKSSNFVSSFKNE